MGRTVYAGKYKSPVSHINDSRKMRKSCYAEKILTKDKNDSSH